MELRLSCTNPSIWAWSQVMGEDCVCHKGHRSCQFRQYPLTQIWFPPSFTMFNHPPFLPWVTGGQHPWRWAVYRVPGYWWELRYVNRSVHPCLWYSLYPCHHFHPIGNLQCLEKRIPMVLTHWGIDTMADILQTTFSNVFSWMMMHEFRLIFHRSLFRRVQLTPLRLNCFKAANCSGLNCLGEWQLILGKFMLNHTEGVCVSSHSSYFPSSDPKNRAKIIWYRDGIWLYLVAMVTILFQFFGKEYFFVLLYAFRFVILLEMSNVDMKVNAQLSYGVFSRWWVSKDIIHHTWNLIYSDSYWRSDQQFSTSLNVMHLWSMHAAK